MHKSPGYPENEPGIEMPGYPENEPGIEMPGYPEKVSPTLKSHQPVVALLHSRVVPVVALLHSRVVPVVALLHSRVVPVVALLHSRVVPVIALLHSRVVQGLSPDSPVFYHRFKTILSIYTTKLFNEHNKVLMQNVKLIVLDVDGTLTDGTLLYGDNGVQSKAFHVADGLGIVMAMAVGLRVAVISGRTSRAVETRLAELNVTDFVQNCGDKAAAMRELLMKYDLEPAQAAYIGDDINDLPAFAVAGFKIAVANAAENLKASADWITPRPGGQGAVRDAIEEILRRQGRLEDAVAAYLAQSRLGGNGRQ